MKPITLERAIRLAESLNPVFNCVENKYDPMEIESYRSVMGGLVKVSAQLGIFEPTLKDMAEIRKMLVFEMTNAAREVVLYRLINQHEHLWKLARISTILEDLPALAVYNEKMAPRAVKRAVQGRELGTAINSALFGRN